MFRSNVQRGVLSIVGGIAKFFPILAIADQVLQTAIKVTNINILNALVYKSPLMHAFILYILFSMIAIVCEHNQLMSWTITLIPQGLLHSKICECKSWLIKCDVQSGLKSLTECV